MNGYPRSGYSDLGFTYDGESHYGGCPGADGAVELDDFGNRIGANYSGTLVNPSQAPPGLRGRRLRFDNRCVWLTMGTIAACVTAGSTNKGAWLLAQSGKGSAPDNGQAQLSVRRFDSPAGPLASVRAQCAM